MRKSKSLLDEYRFPGHKPKLVKGIFGDRHALIIRLERRGKKLCAGLAADRTALSTTGKHTASGTCPAETSAFFWKWKCDEFFVGAAGK